MRVKVSWLKGTCSLFFLYHVLTILSHCSYNHIWKNVKYIRKSSSLVHELKIFPIRNSYRNHVCKCESGVQIRADVSPCVIDACNNPHALSSMDSESHVEALMGKKKLRVTLYFNECVAITLREILITRLLIVESRIRIAISLTSRAIKRYCVSMNIEAKVNSFFSFSFSSFPQALFEDFS